MSDVRSAHAAVPALAAVAPALHRRVRFRRADGSWAEAEMYAVLRPPRLFRGITAGEVAEQATVLVLEREITHDAAAARVPGVVAGA